MIRKIARNRFYGGAMIMCSVLFCQQWEAFVEFKQIHDTIYACLKTVTVLFPRKGRIGEQKWNLGCQLESCFCIQVRRKEP